MQRKLKTLKNCKAIFGVPEIQEFLSISWHFFQEKNGIKERLYSGPVGDSFKQPGQQAQRI